MAMAGVGILALAALLCLSVSIPSCNALSLPPQQARTWRHVPLHREQPTLRRRGVELFGMADPEHVKASNGSSVPTGGDVWPTAIYWTYVEIGTPPAKFPVAIDSGSGDLDVAGKGCVGCITTAPNNAYDHSASSTSKAVFPFGFSNSYQTCDLLDPTAVCTISGKLYKDDVSLAGFGPVSVVLGSIEKQTSNFDQFKRIDGVMGMTFPSDKNVFSQLVKAGHCENVWAMCMVQGAKSNGTLTIGGADPQFAIEPIQYVDDVGEGFHSVAVTGIELGKTGATVTATSTSAVGTQVDVHANAILDTGTNILLVDQSAYTSIKNAMCADASLASCATLWSGDCVTLTPAQVNAYPSLTLQLDGGVNLDMSAADYLLLGSPLAKSSSQYCLGIRNGGSTGGDGWIIGDTTMRNYYLVFDLAQKKIGWGKVNRKVCGNI